MSLHPRFAVLGGTLVALAVVALPWPGGIVGATQQPAPTSAPSGPGRPDADGLPTAEMEPVGTDDPGADLARVPHARTDFNGSWDYNADESINIQTGRPEQRPRSATQRGSVPGVLTPSRGGGGGRGGGNRGGGGGDLGGGSGGSLMGPMNTGPTPAMIRESRDMARDLLEVPEVLTIRVTEDSLTIIDDLQRERVYATDGRKERRQIAASRFDVRTEWRDSQIVQQIEGAFDFKLRITYLLSADSSRLFVMLRLGEARRDQPQAGFDRVYDRVPVPAG